MADKEFKVNDDTMVTMPIRNIIAIIGAVGLAVTVYFDLIQQLHEQQMQIMFLEQRMERFLDKDYADLYARMAEAEDKLADHGH